MQHIKLNIQRFASDMTITCTETGTNIANNTSSITLSVKIQRRSGSSDYWVKPNYRALTVTTSDGQSQSVNTEYPSNKTSVTFNFDFTIPHNGDGTGYVEFTANLARLSSSLPALSASGSATLTTIPRYANITSFSVAQRDETSVQYYYSTDANCDWAWYSIDDGYSWNNLPVNNIITGLQAGHTYNFKVAVRRADSQLTTYSDRYQQTTFDYPQVTSTNDFSIGDGASVFLYNPLARNVTLQLISSVDSSVIGEYSGNYGGVVNNEFKTAWAIDKQYKSIPNALYGTYYASVSCSATSTTTTYNIGSKYYVKETDCKPDMSVVGYEDINATTVALTNNDQTLVNGYSTIQVTIAANNKATANKYASIVGYKIQNGSYISPSIVPEEEGEDVVLTCAATSSIIKVYAIDSRGLSDIYEITNATIIEYTPLTKNQNPIAQRCDAQGVPNGVGEYVKITLDGTYWNNSFGSVTNSIQSISYNYANAQTPSQTTPGETSIIATITNNTYEIDQLILGDTEEGFDVANSYIINVTVEDELSSATFTMTLGSGTPHIAYSPNGVSIMGKYNEEVGGLLQVGGQPISGGTSGDTVPIGAIMPWSSTTIPENWLDCNGQAISRTEYADLFAVIGTTFGAGNGTTTFNVPNFETRIPVGYKSSDSDFNAIGKTGGSKYIQQHNHTQWSYSWAADGTIMYNDSGTQRGLTFAFDDRTSGVKSIDGTTLNTGTSGNLQPYITTKYIIKAFQSSGVIAEVTNTQSDSTTNTYSCHYANNHFLSATTLYTGNSSQAITLSDSVSNYSAIEIEYARGGFTKSTGIIANYGSINLDGYWVYWDTGISAIVFQNFGEIVNVSGTSITRNDVYYTNFIGSNVSSGNFSGGVNILKVIGYK